MRTNQATTWMAVAAITIPVAIWTGAAQFRTVTRAGAADSGPYWAATAASARSDGEQTFSERPPKVQAVMQRMYDASGNYQSLSGLFLDASPGDPRGSLDLYINQPDSVATAASHASDGSGPPYEETDASGALVTLSSPTLHLATVLRQDAAPLPALASVPLSVMPLVASYTSVRGLGSGPISWLADMFVHPATESPWEKWRLQN